MFYGLGSTELGCTSQVEHSVDTGDAKPINRNPYRTPHALKPVVEQHIDEMLRRHIIEPSMSPWSSSIVLVQKKSRDGSIKYRFCIDYRSRCLQAGSCGRLVPSARWCGKAHRICQQANEQGGTDI